MGNWRITNTFFTGLINRLGIRPPPRDGFAIQDIVVPVSLIDADISLPVSLTSTLIDVASIFTAGEINTPGAATRLADTGAQNAGNYLATVWVGADGANGSPGYRIKRRNAGDAADVWSFRFGLAQTTSMGFNFLQISIRFVLLSNERLVVENIAAGPAGYITQAQIMLQAS